MPSRARRLADERLSLEQLEHAVARAVGADDDDVAGDLPLQLVGRAEGDDLAVVDDRDAVAERVRLLEVVRRQEHGRAGVAQLAHLVPHPRAALRIEARRRLVEEQQLRQVHEPDADVEPALLPAGIGLRRAVGAVGELERGDQLRGALHGARALVMPVEPSLHDQLGAPRDLGCAAALLAHVADLVAHLGRVVQEVEPGDRRLRRS